MSTFRTALAPIVLLAAALARADYTETFNGGASDPDTGWWCLTTQTNRVREIRPSDGASGGATDGYLYNEVSSAIPGWSTASPDFQPGYDADHKQHGPFVDDYLSRGVTDLSADLQIFPTSTGAWTGDRALTLYLKQADSTGDGLAYTASYTIEYPTSDRPVGWNHVDFNIDATSKTVPAGWTLTDGEGNASDDWGALMSKIDVVTIGFYKPGYFYPSLGMWQMGLDNVSIHTQAVPEPGVFATLGLGCAAFLRRRRKA